MFAYVECRDCNYYVESDFKCILATGYAHNPTDYCARKGHYFAFPRCSECGYYDIRGLRCGKLGSYMKPYDFCSIGEYRE